MSRKPPGAAMAAKMLSDDEIVAQLKMDRDALAFVKRCSSGRPPRNAIAGLQAIRMRLEWSQPKPKIGVEHSGSVTYQLVDPFARDRGDG